MTCEKRWDEMRWEELMIWDEMCRVRKVQVWSVKCRVWRVQCEVWGKSSLGVALRLGCAQVMFLDNNTATASHKARTHGPGWRTAHASSRSSTGKWFMKAQVTHEKRWDEKRWAGIRWEELRWDEVWSVKSAVWSVGREECSVKSEVWSVKCGVRRMQCEVWSVECEVWSVECEECSEKCEVRSGASNVTCEAGQHFRRMHARTGLAGARCTQVL